MHLIRKDRNLALAGAAVLILGLFCPIMTLPFAGPINFFAGAKISAPALLALALIAGGLALSGRVRDALWPGIAAATLLLYHFATLLTNLPRMRGDAAEAAAAFQSPPAAAAAAVQVEWGWLVLALGAGMVILAAASSRRAAQVPAFAPQDGQGKAILRATALMALGAIGWSLAPH